MHAFETKGLASPVLPVLVFLVGILLAIGAPRPAAAGVILGEPIFGGRLLVATDGPVTATYLGSDAGYFNTLYLEGFDGPLFTNGEEFTDFGSFDFSKGTELVFRLDVRKEKNDRLPMHSFFSGDLLRNPDDLAHAQAITTFDVTSGKYVTTVGFEDLLGGGDNDFNDFMFQLTNVIDPLPVPAPPVLVLLGIGLAGIGYLQRKHMKVA